MSESSFPLEAVAQGPKLSYSQSGELIVEEWRLDDHSKLNFTGPDLCAKLRMLSSRWWITICHTPEQTARRTIPQLSNVNLTRCYQHPVLPAGYDDRRRFRDEAISTPMWL